MKILHTIKNNPVLVSAFSYIVKNNTSNNASYHNLYHLLFVADKCLDASNFYGFTNKERNNLMLAALFHDFDHSQGKENDSVNIQNAIFGFKVWLGSIDPGLRSEVDFSGILRAINATQYPYVIPARSLELNQSIIRDADLMMSRGDDWLNTVILGLSSEMKINDLEKMVVGQENFLNGVEMITEWGKNYWESTQGRVERNLDLLKLLL